MLELQQIADFVREKVHPNAEIIMGTVIDDTLDGDIQMTLIATGFEPAHQAQTHPAAGYEQAPSTQAAFAMAPDEPRQPTREEILDNLTFKPVAPRSLDELATPTFLHSRQASANSAGSSNGARRWDPDAALGRE